ncbi:MAG: DUF433 domain-containing protein [Candidatus Binatia bacterium]
MAPISFQHIGKGVYSLAEAERLIKIPRQRISRWTRGYTYRYKGETRRTPPLIAGDTKQIADKGPILSFLDLLEVRFLDAFLVHGVSRKAVRIAALNAQELLGRHHPFSTRIFKTDGRSIFAEIVRGTDDKRLLNIVENQYEFDEIVAPYLYEGIEFNASNDPERWWPLGKRHIVVIDPKRGFGTPIVARSGVPTKVLAGAFKAEGSVAFVAKWYEVSEREVRDAVLFEERLAA